jgi:integrase
MAARTLNKLTAKQLAGLKPGRHADGGNLWVEVTLSGSRSFAFVYTLAGRKRWKGLGSCRNVSLADAREQAAGLRQMVAQGVDPLEERNALPTSGKTMAEAVAAFLASREPGWRPTTVQAMRSLTGTIVAGLGDIGTGSVSISDTVPFLQAMWARTPKRAGAVRRVGEQVLDFAVAMGWRPADMRNPFQWKGVLSPILPKPGMIRPTVHRRTVPWQEMPALWADLRSREGVGAQALRLVILTALRSREVVGMRWSEVDFQTATVTIPASRMKSKREFRVPLSPAVMVILREMRAIAIGEHVFSIHADQPASPMVMLSLLRRMGRGDFVPHGGRSCFRSWCADHGVPREVAESCLAHVAGVVERSYQRSDLLNARRDVMAAWAAHVCGSAERSALSMMQVRA